MIYSGHFDAVIMTAGPAPLQLALTLLNLALEFAPGLAYSCAAILPRLAVQLIHPSA
jgi:hypothetical protein